jgi:phytoene dehydrogenase-like protein
LYTSRKIVLNAASNPLVNNAQMISNVAPSYAPPGRHLLSAAVLGVPEMSDTELIVAVVRDLRQMFAGNNQALRALSTYYPLRVYRIPYAQFPQPPGIYRTLPSHGTMLQSLYIAAEYTDASSINGAMTSGERCAATVGQELKQRQSA